MKALLIDAGNSRIKWCLFEGSRAGRAHAAVWTSGTIDRVAIRVLRGFRQLDAILVCSVAGRNVVNALRRAARDRDLVVPRFVRSERRAAGITNGYRDPWRLGVDRWVAMMGARAKFPDRALCIVDIGTATTIDLLDAAGRHRGGAIAPGPALMVSSLLSHTAQIRRRAGRGGGSSGGQRQLFARDTRAALNAGANYAIAGLVEQAMQSARRQLGATPLLVLAGGGAQIIAPLLPRPFRRIDDLVLRGLAVLARTPTG